MGIHKDATNQYWISHNEGLTRFNPDTLKVRHYTNKFGANNGEFLVGSSFNTQQGIIYFGGFRGVVTVDASAAGNLLSIVNRGDLANSPSCFRKESSLTLNTTP